jgi:predicted AAA+ superfamily ATPase
VFKLNPTISERYLKSHLLEGLQDKIVLVTGPRQVGKTTLSKGLSKDLSYYNYDIKSNLKTFKDQTWDRNTEYVVFDELHKMKKWKLWLKGIYDEGLKQKVLVTGSARLEFAKRVGDSLAGRYFTYRLNPLDLKELKGEGKLEENYRKLIEYGGFPEPFFKNSKSFYGQWKNSHQQAILRDDMLSMEGLRDLDGVETLVQLLSERVGSTISSNGLAEELGRDDKTIKHWLDLLENYYVVFKITPYSKNITRAKKKASKYYFYDVGSVQGDEGQKFENLVALSLKKEIEYRIDTEGENLKLHFIQNREQREIDFVVLGPEQKITLYEVKLSDDEPSKNFELFEKHLKKPKKIQLVRNLKQRFDTKSGIAVEPGLLYLENLKL